MTPPPPDSARAEARPPRTSGASEARQPRASGASEAPVLPEELSQRRFARQRRQAVTVIVALAIPLAAFGINDYLYSAGDWRKLVALLAVRGIAIAAMGWVGLLLARAPSLERFERVLFVAMSAGVVLSVLTHLARPSDVLVVSRFELLSVVGYYLAFPIRTVLGAVPALVLSLASIGLSLWWHTGVSAPDLVSVVICFGLANALGFLIARQREVAEDEEEIAWRALTSVNANLRTTLRELRALQAVVPVCPSCRKVRGAHAGWQQLEAYVAERGDIKFSSILCPDCLQAQFGAVLPESDRRG